MPAAAPAPSQAIDWHGLQTAAVAIGSVNAVAVQAGANLPPDEAERLRQRINKRGLREGWLSKLRTLIAPTNAKPLSQPVQTGADSIANLHAENSQQTRTSLGKAVVKASKTFEDMDGPEIIEKGQQLRHVAASGAQVFGWEDRKANDAGLVAVTLIRLELSEQAIEKPAKVIDLI